MGKARKNPPKALTAKQKRFIDEFLVDCNGAQAAIRAGYSGKNPNNSADQIMSSVVVKAAITKALDARAARVHLTQDEVLSELAASLRRPIDDPGWDGGDRVRTLELSMKHLGMMRERIDIDHRFPPLEELLPGRINPPLPAPEVE